MRLTRLALASLLAALGLAGALASTVATRLDSPARTPVDQIAMAVTVGAYAVVSVLIAASGRAPLVAWFMAGGVGAWGSGEALLAFGLRDAGGAAAWLVTLGTALRASGWLLLILAVPFVFPDGGRPWPRRRAPGIVVASAIALFTVGTLLAPVPLDR